MENPIVSKKNLLKVNWDSKLKAIEKYNTQNWMKVHGKVPEMYKKQQNDLKNLFNELDSDKSGVVSTEELFEMLLSLGLVSSKSEVEDLVKFASSKSSGVLKFDEFMKLFVNNDGFSRRKGLNTLVNSVARNLRRLKTRDLPLSISLCNRKRSLMLQAYVGENFGERDKGLKLISAFASEANSPKSPSKEERIIYRQTCDLIKHKKTARETSLPKRKDESFMNYLPPVNVKRGFLRKNSRVKLMGSLNHLNNMTVN